ncbi:MAG: DUF559 domain-containing protein [bacterium]|nr:DUF559 domain-containing protein [bacterium]
MTGNLIHYDSKLKPLSRALRTDSVLAEVLVWQKLRARQMMGFQFLRQRPIDKYIVDFDGVVNGIANWIEDAKRVN